MCRIYPLVILGILCLKGQDHDSLLCTLHAYNPSERQVIKYLHRIRILFKKKQPAWDIHRNQFMLQSEKQSLHFHHLPQYIADRPAHSFIFFGYV